MKKTTKTTEARTTGTETATVKKSRRRELSDEEVRQLERQFDADLRTAQSLLPHITTEEFCYLLGRCGEQKHFPRALLRVLGRANRRRDALLKPHVEQLERLMPEILEGYDVTPEDVRVIISRLRELLDLYSGPPVSEPFVWWAMEQVAGTITALRIMRKVELQNPVVFADLYRRTYRAAFAGVWEILRHCKHLAATPNIARQVVQDCFTKIFLSAEDWRDDGTASIPTRVRAYAEAQAMGWRTEQIRERQKERRMRGAMRRYGLPVKTRRRRAE